VIEQLCNCEQTSRSPARIHHSMVSNSTLLCIHRDPDQLSLLKESGYEVATATNGSDGLRLFTSRPVDAVVLEYHLGLMDGTAVADEIKHIRPEVPIVMLTDHVELPPDALRSVDALVVKSDGCHFLLATVHFVLNVKPAQRRTAKPRRQTPTHLCRPGRPPAATEPGQINTQSEADRRDAPLSMRTWRDIWNGTIRF
jgi:CheY-like chemotaxis protein